MRRRLQRMFAAILLTVCVGAPILEMFDRWDHTLQDGNDTESNLVVVMLCVGVGFIAATVVMRRFHPTLMRTVLRAVALVGSTFDSLSLTPPDPHASPPLALRI